jgi:dTDP-4-dehydrorhamnose reductase
VLLIGCNGLLGQKLAELLLRGSGYQVIPSSVEPAPVQPLLGNEYVRLDITSRKDVRSTVAAVAPTVIINAAAMTNVDACEQEREAAWRINVDGVEHLAEATRRTNAHLVHISTDYVFDGKAGPYTEDDRPEPINYYGKTKLASENLLRSGEFPATILRTMVLYGFVGLSKPNFALWLVDNLTRKMPVRVVDDQIGNPTLVDDLAYAILSAMELKRTGLYHVAGRDILSRYDFALQLARVFEADEGLITPVKTAALRQPAARPLNSGLITLKAEVELGFRPSTAAEGLRVLRTQILRAARDAEDHGARRNTPG